jgi:pimeloyl-ACP methyl ester carboxylesterase
LNIKRFDSDGVEIAYRVEGVGAPILLIHGFASNHAVNWVDTGWVKTLVSDGRKVIAIDNRGHGESEKLYDSARYGAPVMAEDARRLLDHLKIERADVLGYSMGTRIAAFLAINHGARVRSAVFGGLAESMIKGIGGAEPIAAALEAPSMSVLRDPGMIAYRRFAEVTRSDLRALAACIRASRQKISTEEVGRIGAPVMVAAGSDDNVAGSVAYLAERIPGARSFVIEGKDHMTSVGDRTFKQAVANFLGERP